MNPLISRIQGMMANVVLIETNGRNDGLDGKDRDKGWNALADEMNLRTTVSYGAYRVAYENGWHEGWLERQKKEQSK